MKRIFAVLIFLGCMIFPAMVSSQTSGNTPPPPPVCGSTNAGALYTNTGTSPATVYTCSYYNLEWQWVVNPSYGGLVYYTTPPITCSGALPVFLAGWPNTLEYVCISGVPTAIGQGTFSTLTGDVTSTATGGATTVHGLAGVPFCTGFSPTSGQALQYTIASSPNPCYTAATSAPAGLPLSGGTLTGALNGTSASFSGTVAAATVSGSVNGVLNITAFGAVGDCTGQGSTTSCTDNFTAIQDAINAAWAGKGSVYFPTNLFASANQTVYYTSQAINPKGVSMFGPAGGSGPPDSAASAQPVAIRGAPGQDVFDVPDTGSTGYSLANMAFSVRDLSILIDDTENASSSFPNRFPGRHCFDAAMTSSSAVLTSSEQCQFQPGDVGQPISVAGAGASAATLVTTVSSWQTYTQVTLAASASTSVTNAATYISVANLPVTQTIGNCGFAMDASGSAGPASEDFPLRASFTNVSINTIDNQTSSNYNCGYFFQGNSSPYQTKWEHDYVGSEFGFVFAPPSAAAGQANTCPGICDFNVVDATWIIASYPWISYGGNADNLNNVQIAGEVYGPQILNGNGISLTGGQNASRWHIDIPEMENPPVGCPAVATDDFRIAGLNHVIDHLSLAGCALQTFQWDASYSTVAMLGLDTTGTVSITGTSNTFNAPLFNSYPSYHVTGTGNTFVTGSPSGPAWSEYPGRLQYASGGLNVFGPPQLSRGSVVFDRKHDFIEKGVANYYFNDEDLWIWPQDMLDTLSGQGPIITPDSTSDSGEAVNVVGTTTQTIGGADGTEWSVGSQIPAGPVRLYVKVKASAAVSGWVFEMYDGSTICSVSGNLTTSYQVFSCDGTLAGLSGTDPIVYLSAPGTGYTAYVAWVAIRPWDSGTVTTSLTVGQGATPITSQSSANSQVVTCPTGGTTTKYCDAAGAWVPAIQIRAGTWSISATTSVAVTFATAMGVTPTNCSVTPSASTATTGQPFATALATTGFTVNVPTSGTIAGTYSCDVNNAN